MRRHLRAYLPVRIDYGRASARVPAEALRWTQAACRAGSSGGCWSFAHFPACTGSHRAMRLLRCGTAWRDSCRDSAAGS